MPVPGTRLGPCGVKESDVVEAVAVAIIEDHVLVRDGLVHALSARPNLELVYVGDTLPMLLALPRTPDSLCSWT